ncbi:cell division protein ZapE [Paracoccus sp. 1_MG-2023]|uniref:cell division protein ZapE n=1 Tax=unclassified Paracoccus (in: a-proteobacteria) TaxID=2688777 RepID=UPI001C09111A|nr:MULTISPECIES: cell division protein ZapE [unclassified Paracoccus (in: a-proteobacteria)]MBU2956307.1 AFG1 family ATPase [Paracoccus sp. C2R09]MDO6667983.1 cell division protein ZapE [Paracoccus sp. 1_MG-2023]
MGRIAEIYGRKADAGEIRPDPAQKAVLPEMDRVLGDLSQAPAPAAPARRGWRSLFGGGSEPAAVTGGRGLYLWGGVGRGKSMLMDLMAGAARDQGIAVRRVHFHEFMQEIQAGLEEARKRGDQDTVRPVAMGVAAKVRLLCFDEMQITDIADAMIVGRLFQVLFDQGVTVVTTSNRVPEDLYKNGLNRQLFLPFITLLRERMAVVCLDSDNDYRQNREGSPIWFTPVNADARQALDAEWDALTDGAQPEPASFEVKGRQVELQAMSGDVARAGFWDLCGRPLGAADYLMLASKVRVLILDGVPRLNSANYNEAKRFVTLIDALYEAKVRLIASAADEPERLYGEGEGSFEFERTASRLREMQDAGWGRADG